MSENNTITIREKEAALALRWIQMATYKGVGRESLSGIFNDNGKWVAADGYRLHIAKNPVLPDTLKSEVVTKLNRNKPLNKTTGKAYPVELVSGAVYPDYAQITGQVDGKEPKAVITFHKNQLKELAEMPDDANGDLVTIEVYETMDPINAYNDDYRAVIMPFIRR